MKKILISGVLASVLLLGITSCGSSSHKKVTTEQSQNNNNNNNGNNGNGNIILDTTSNDENIDKISIDKSAISNYAIDLGSYDAVSLSGEGSDNFKIIKGDIYVNSDISEGAYVLTINANNPTTNQSGSTKLKVIITDPSSNDNTNNNSGTDNSNQNNNNNTNTNNNNNQNLSISDFTVIAEENALGEQNRVTQAKAKQECENLGMRLPTFDELSSVLNVNNIATIADFDTDGDSSVNPNSFASVIWSSEPDTGLWFQYNSATNTITPVKFEGGDENSKYYYTCVPKN